MTPPKKKQKKDNSTSANGTSNSNSDSTSSTPKSSTTTNSNSKLSRSISACKRCRSKKIKCDSKFPQCSNCLHHKVECVGVDPVTGREIPRSYVVHLEETIKKLEQQLINHGVSTNGFDYNSQGNQFSNDQTILTPSVQIPINQISNNPQFQPVLSRNNSSNIPNSSGKGDITFSKLMSTAVKVQKRNNEKKPINDSQNGTVTEDEDNDLLHSAAVLPPKSTALQFCQVFFHQCNAQLPLFHREEFIRDYFIPIYGPIESSKFNFASNNGSIDDSFWTNRNYDGYWFDTYKLEFQNLLSDKNEDIRLISNSIIPPKRYHIPLFFLNMVFAIASSVHHLRYPSHISESFRLAAMKYYDDVKENQDRLLALQGILIYAYYSIMRPTNPGIWYIMGEALRICVDLDLQNELKTKSKENVNIDAYTRDKRRRIFWCTYSIDRQICFYLDRPFGIPDESINTPLPTLLDDSKLKPQDPLPTGDIDEPSYKHISLAFINVRKIQSEVTKILYTSSEIPRQFQDLNHWKSDVLSRLSDWYHNLPTAEQRNCDFNSIFFKLNYHHTLLYIHGLGPRNFNLSWTDMQQVSVSSKEITDVYFELLSSKSVNYTWAGVHNLFMAGSSYLYTLFNSEEIRKQNPIDLVLKVTSNCFQILQSLIDKCEAANYCCEIFHNLTKVIIQLKYPGEHNFEGPRISKESIYRINNGNVNSNLFSLINELDHLNPLISPSSELVSDQISPKSHQNPVQQTQVNHLYQRHRHEQEQQHQLLQQQQQQQQQQQRQLQTEHGQTKNESNALLQFENFEWNDVDFDYFFEELNHNRQSEKSSPTTNREGKMSFELLHNMTNDRIWDEFFTSK
ncbi:PPR1 [Candida pseudojiufengensis]|uniref:PPR1 n=1 Tax=Candida pseudojiufengensis TaxID=497109 RepID=UPI002225277A|nr:PPR1 [Candida pseudojiufengensis]KAI5964358.1 PPR1 [Candida pseudojiufengensis]